MIYSSSLLRCSSPWVAPLRCSSLWVLAASLLLAVGRRRSPLLVVPPSPFLVGVVSASMLQTMSHRRCFSSSRGVSKSKRLPFLVFHVLVSALTLSVYINMFVWNVRSEKTKIGSMISAALSKLASSGAFHRDAALSFLTWFRDGLVEKIDEVDSVVLEAMPSTEEIRETMEGVGYGVVTTASMSILINGSPSKPFKMERGLRQGDPLSPFFVLVVDVLHRMVGEAVRNRRISPLVVVRDNVELSHLQFADDTILFCPPEEETMKNYKRLLRLWGFKECTLPVKYLRIPLGENPMLVKTWKPIIDNVEEKLSLWKAMVLNKVGKLVLITSVLNSLPVYYLSLYKMPKAVAEKLISLQKSFLWSKEDGRNSMVLVRWNLV
ncbi:uncharacterized protein LOC130939873 [Arachis stenosperma]|uniref:uncharacterized protein LOC130939873 n=1 Tax=Arachis stenosperma TaxID=217475 RepID=UPI0025AC0D9D|nr:uncharacterized protein LOC130939873 [Arachis stenosperma]